LTRYLVQVAVAVLVVWLAGGPGVGRHPAAIVAATVVATGFINAFNFMDGIDALVAGTGVVILGFLSWFTSDALWMVLAASYAGFLAFNLPPARVFMGDAGSTSLGGLVATAVLAGRASLEARHLLIFLPLVGDAIYTVTRRLLRGENIFAAHHSHLYQRLLRAGHSHARISASYAAATFVVGLVAAWGGAGACAAAAIVWLGLMGLQEAYLARRGVPFTRPPSR
jgi:UDP-N-acetylmuramyl pentapeptide phosphotransferase/UDP-N-acetylglucosamine-1-phosphate transferase